METLIVLATMSYIPLILLSDLFSDPAPHKWATLAGIIFVILCLIAGANIQ